MILDKDVNIKVNNRYLKFYYELGYGKLKQGDFINLPIKYLPKQSNYIIIEDSVKEGIRNDISNPDSEYNKRSRRSFDLF